MERHKHVCSKRRLSQAQKETLYLIVYRQRSGRLRSLPNGMGVGEGEGGMGVGGIKEDVHLSLRVFHKVTVSA